MPFWGLQYQKRTKPPLSVSNRQGLQMAQAISNGRTVEARAVRRGRSPDLIGQDIGGTLLTVPPAQFCRIGVEVLVVRNPHRHVPERSGRMPVIFALVAAVSGSVFLSQRLE